MKLQKFNLDPPEGDSVIKKKRFFTIAGISPVASLYCNQNSGAMKDLRINPAIIFAGLGLIAACNPINRLTIHKKEKMFTVQQLIAAHAKVKSGADFPSYIREIKSLGVTHYEAYVTDGHIDYHSGSGYTATVPAKYEPLAVAPTPKTAVFRAELLNHQQGKTNYLTFISMCAATGIEKWEIRMDRMTCTYYDSNGNKILVEEIPQ